MSKQLLYSYSDSASTSISWCPLGGKQLARTFDGFFCMGGKFIINFNNHVKVIIFLEPLVYAGVKGAQELSDRIQEHFCLNENGIIAVRIEDMKNE